MGKKGAKRKTRWRTLSIGSPPGEDDEEDGGGVSVGSRNGYGGSSKSGDHYRHNDHHYNNDYRTRGERGSNGYVAATSSNSWPKSSRHGSAGSSNGSSSNGHQSAAGSTTSGYASSRSRRDDVVVDGGKSQQQKIMFNEDEYTRITTPRQDMLFKKSYLAQRKPWTSAASMSATPSTTESQSASHSTADGSETAEDQQLLDANGIGEIMMEPPPPLSYGTYYDHTSGYYYECPMMLVGPAVPEPLAPNVLAAMPCAPVPLRPIEWVNPAFVPKLQSQQYCYVDYQGAQGTDCAALVDAQGVPLAEPIEIDEIVSEADVLQTTTAEAATTNGLLNGDELSDNVDPVNNVNGLLMESTSVVVVNDDLTMDTTATSHVGTNDDHQLMSVTTATAESIDQTLVEQEIQETYEAPSDVMEYVPESGYIETLPAQPVHHHLGGHHHHHHHHHVVPQQLGHQSYIYPGQYMFGPPVINVNGVTIQSGPMLRYSEMAPNSSADAAGIRRRRKKKKKKLKRITGNMDEDDEFSSDGETIGYTCHRSSSSAWSTAESSPLTQSLPTTSQSQDHESTTQTCNFISNRPLNPECQEFRLRHENVDDDLTKNSSLNNDNATINGEKLLLLPCNDGDHGTKNNNEPKRLTDEQLSRAIEAYDDAVTAAANDDDDVEAVVEEEIIETKVTSLTNGDLAGEVVPANGDDDSSLRLTIEPEMIVNETLRPIDDDDDDDDNVNNVNNNNNNHDNSSNNSSSSSIELSSSSSSSSGSSSGMTSPRRDDQRIVQVFTNETTTKLEIESAITRDVGLDGENDEVVTDEKKSVDEVAIIVQSATVVETQTMPKDSDLDICQTWTNESTPVTFESSLRDNNETTTTKTKDPTSPRTSSSPLSTINDEDTSKDNQQRVSNRPITDAVNEWLKRVNSPDLFVTSRVTSGNNDVDDDDDDNDDDDESNAALSNEPSKNLQGNPMPALSVNGRVEVREPSRREFAMSADRVEIFGNDDDDDDDVMVVNEFMPDLNVSLLLGIDGDGYFKSAKKKDRRERVRCYDSVLGYSEDRDRKRAMARCVTVSTITSSIPLKRKINDGTREFNDEDSDAGMRVAKKSRINAKRSKLKSNDDNVDDNVNDRDYDDDDDHLLPVKTYEKGEIVVSMDGELLLVAKLSRDDDNDDKTMATITTANYIDDEIDEERSLGSIEEPDVLEYWEAEIVGPLTINNDVSSKLTSLIPNIDEIGRDDDYSSNVKTYHRVNAVSCVETKKSVIDRDDDDDDDNNSCYAYTQSTTLATATEIKARSVGDDGSRLPIDEAYEAYESFYNGDRSYTIDWKHNSVGTRSLFVKDGEGAVPCKAVCCNIQ